MNYLQVAGFADVRIIAVQQLQHLTFGDRIGCVGQHFHDPHVVDFDHHLKRAGIQEVAYQYRRRIAKLGVRSVPSPSKFGFVDHVIMQKSRRVDELDDRRQKEMMPVAAVTKRTGNQQQQHRAHPFSAGSNDVLRDLVDQSHLGRQAFADDRVDFGQVRSQHGKELGRLHFA